MRSTTDHRTVDALLTRRAVTHRDATFIEDPERAYSYGTVDDLVERIASALISSGVTPGARVALAMPNGIDFVVVLFAVARAGAILVPLNLDYRDSQVGYVLGDADAELLITTRDFLDAHRGVIVESGVRVVVSGDEGVALRDPSIVAWRTFQDHASDQQMPAVRSQDPMAIIYTSGTTGDPKGVLLCHEHQLTLADNIGTSIELTEQDCFYNFYPLHHNTGLAIITLAVLGAGARMFLVEKFSKSRFWSDVKSKGCTVFYGMGPILELLDKVDDADKQAEGHPLRVCFGLAVGEDQVARFSRRFGVRFVSGYGSTEVNMIAIAAMPTGHPGSAGKVVDDFEVVVVDSDDEPLPFGQIGEIVVRPRRPHITYLGYWRKPDATVRAWRNLWAHTGDAGRIDEDGYLYFSDRIDDVIRHRGNNVASLEIENVILTHASIDEVAVIPVASELGEFDEDICAVVVARAGHDVDPAMLVDLCRQELPKYAVPRYVEVVGELPKTATGKIRKVVLRGQAAGPARWDAESH